MRFIRVLSKSIKKVFKDNQFKTLIINFIIINKKEKRKSITFKNLIKIIK